ncbi:DUF1059 domain-containing protein [Haloarchaeobius salinus]|uniref:DUF1059 domain-containing protein n=1 Tax=Haloarchaeobius salinus TaxID=1198298 RepID=UPI00210E3556|nr:DUF1059 domain-containing protein [Haloarchaeobius salinus]
MVKAFECSLADCSFEVRSEDEGEIVSMVREHAQNVHGMSMNEGDIKSNMTEMH